MRKNKIQVFMIMATMLLSGCINIGGDGGLDDEALNTMNEYSKIHNELNQITDKFNKLVDTINDNTPETQAKFPILASTTSQVIMSPQIFDSSSQVESKVEILYQQDRAKASFDFELVLKSGEDFFIASTKAFSPFIQEHIGDKYNNIPNDIPNENICAKALVVIKTSKGKEKYQDSVMYLYNCDFEDSNSSIKIKANYGFCGNKGDKKIIVDSSNSKGSNTLEFTFNKVGIEKNK